MHVTSAFAACRKDRLCAGSGAKRMPNSSIYWQSLNLLRKGRKAADDFLLLVCMRWTQIVRHFMSWNALLLWNDGLLAAQEGRLLDYHGPPSHQLLCDAVHPGRIIVRNFDCDLISRNVLSEGHNV